MELANQKILVIGLGKTGKSAAQFLVRRGARVAVTDSRPAADFREWMADEAGSGDILWVPNEPSSLGGVDMVVPSPGIPPADVVLSTARRQGVPVLSEIELAARFLRIPMIAVTGTNGKTTVTTLLGEIFRDSGTEAFVGGNIGTPLIECAGAEGNARYAVVEVSSFQLQYIETFRPFVSLILNVTADHVDYHGTFEAYRRAKERIFENQKEGDRVVLNADDPYLSPPLTTPAAPVLAFSTLREPEEGIFLRGDRMLYRTGGVEEEYPLDMIRIPGRHNVENVMAAILAARACGCSREKIVETVGSFRGVSHRIEFAGEKNGVSFYDDSKGTNTGAVQRALETFSRPVILLMGGRDKDGDFASLEEAVRQRVKRLILFGEAAERIGGFLGGVVPTEEAGLLENAVRRAYAEATPGDVVLLSPGCASFDAYADYRHRGRHFQQIVGEL
ncbi:MAG: UDP-N-acetylmuramoyl-L-alanine--D-glutamate ligase [Syntrophaceae bacterium]|nr:UDP-N-acetylmuramoyl-L-alanine--D-glutamate ligase [Syntrophaceae bacterium]